MLGFCGNGLTCSPQVQEPAAEQLSIVIDDEHCHDDEIPQGTDKSPGRSTPILDEHQEVYYENFSLFVWGFTLYQQYFSYLTATVHNPHFLDHL